CSATASCIAMRSKTASPPEVADVLDLLESQPEEARMASGGFSRFSWRAGWTMPGAKRCIRTCGHGLSVSAVFGE
ncbi:hypothetical protein, partial [Lysinibacillus antri]|uniref:hypothetical protein n=1 Tax=Lysinibacillus antri TaxID=2498145 RepID=UPI00131A2E2E